MANIFNIIALLVALVTLLITLKLYLKKPIYFEPTWMDSPLTSDPNIDNPKARLSTRIPYPTDEQKKQPVAILIHGFSASSYEFKKFITLANTQPHNILFSTIVLGGHGRNYETFKQKKYHQWFQPVVNEFKQLLLMGYTNISFCAVSASATGLIYLINQHQIDPEKIKQIIYIDPFIISKNKLIHFIPVLKPFIKNSKATTNNKLASSHRYINRPANALNELRKLLVNTQNILKNIQQPNHFPKTTIFTSSNDPTSDTKSAELIQNALGNEKVSIHRYDSKHHIIINPSNKKNWTDSDQNLFEKISNEILGLLRKS